MIKKVALAGVQLDNYTVRESIMQVEKSLNNDVFNTMEDISMEMIVTAGEDERVKLVLNNLDHALISDIGVLSAIDEVSMQRKHEIEENDFYFEFMKRVERNHKTIYVLGQTMEKVNESCDLIMKDFPRCNIVGTEALENFGYSTESLVNEINTLAPDVVLSVIPSPAQEYFLLENRDKLSTNLWYGMGSERLKMKHEAFHKIRERIRRIRFQKSIRRFDITV